MAPSYSGCSNEAQQPTGVIPTTNRVDQKVLTVLEHHGVKCLQGTTTAESKDAREGKSPRCSIGFENNPGENLEKNLSFIA